MEVELVQLSRIPQGLVSSSIIHDPGENVEAVSPKSGEILVSICSTGRLMAFISSYKAQFIASDNSINLSEGTLPQYVNSYEGLLHVVREPSLPRPSATACTIIPVTIELRPDTVQTSSVIIVGFTDGYIRGYTKTGKTVLVQQLHSDAVVKLVVMSQAPSYGQSSYIQPCNLAVLLKGSIVCIVDGLSLTEVIKHNVLRNSEDDFDLSSETVVAVSYKKFHIQEQTTTQDVALIGQSTLSAFDYLREASVLGGYDTVIRSGPSPEARLITVGEQPMVALYRITKDAGTLNMSEVVHAVASRMTSAVMGKLSAAGGWFGWGSGKNVSQTPTKAKTPEEKQKPTMNLPMSTNIPDPRRQIYSVVVSPIGNLAALVDEFGRVMLLDTGNLVIRRIWKGYRDAQCGWLAVSDPSEISRRAQCLSIYASRRGILEFWPVQAGDRVAAFQVGKGCRLLYSTQCMFGTEDLLRELGSHTKGVGDRALLLSADGRLLTFSVPFPALIKRSSPRSHDSHMILKLDQAICSGDETLVEEVALSVKSSQTLQEIIKVVIDGYSNSGSNISKEVVRKILNISVYRTISDDNYTVPMKLHNHFKSLRCLSQFYFNIEECNTTNERGANIVESTETLTKTLEQCCGLASFPAKHITSLINPYFQSYEPVKRVRQQVHLCDFIKCFSTLDDVVDCLLPQMKAIDYTKNISATESVSLKMDLAESTLKDLAEFIFMQLLTFPSSSQDIQMIFEDSCISPSNLLMLLLKVWLNGSISESNPILLVQALSTLTLSILGLISKDETSFWYELQKIISNSCLSGHALLAAILCQHLSKAVHNTEIITTIKEVKVDPREKETDAEEEEEEEWETLTIETEQWANLCEHLELLTNLSLLTGSKALQSLPPVLFVTCEEEEEEEEGSLDLNKLRIKMLFGDEDQGVCVSTLQTSGPALIGHCIARSLISRRIPSKLILEINKEKSHGQESRESKNVIQRIQSLSDALPHSLSTSNILLYCGFQAALQWSDSKSEERSTLLSLALDYITEVPSVKLTQGICGFLWHSLLQKEVTELLEIMKKKAVNRDIYTSELLWACRSIISYLLNLSFDYKLQEKEHHVDVIKISRPSHMKFLPAILYSFPAADQNLLRSCLQLLLLVESVLECNSPVSVFSYFAPVFRSNWKKGIFLSQNEGDNIQKVVGLRRMKFVCGAVSVIVNGKQPSIKPNAFFVSSRNLPKTNHFHCFEFAEFSDMVFALSSLWDLDVDGVRTHWVANLYATGLDDKGKEIFHAIHDKTSSSVNLLAVGGHLSLRIINKKDKQTQSIMLAQTSPRILEWMRKQVHHPSVSTIMKVSCSAKHVLQLMEILRPHLMTSNSELLSELTKLLAVLVNRFEFISAANIC